MYRSWLSWASIVVLLVAVPAAAQEDPALSNAPAAAPLVVEPEGAYGLLTQDTWIGANEFNPMSGTEVWAYQTFLFYSIAGGTGGAVTKQLNLDLGARVTGLSCTFNDTSATGNGTVNIWKNTYNIVTNARNNVLQVSVASTGATGFQNPAATTNFVVRHNEGDDRVIYWLQVLMPNGDTAVSFRGCRITWARTVSAGPAVATFADVPTTSGQFRFVEALVAAGVTAGCGGGNYCPNAPVTRGEMAVFIAASLGMHFPN